MDDSFVYTGNIHSASNIKTLEFTRKKLENHLKKLRQVCMESKFVLKVFWGSIFTKQNDRFCWVLPKESAHVLADGVNTRLARRENPKEVKIKYQSHCFFYLQM